MDDWADPWKDSAENPAVAGASGSAEGGGYGLEDGQRVRWGEGGIVERQVGAWESPWADARWDDAQASEWARNDGGMGGEMTADGLVEELKRHDSVTQQPVAPLDTPASREELSASTPESSPEPSDDGGSLSPKSARGRSGHEDEGPVLSKFATPKSNDLGVDIAVGQPAAAGETYSEPKPIALPSKPAPENITFVDLSLVSDLFGQLPDVDPELSRSITDDILSYYRVHNTWSRISRKQTLRGWKDDYGIDSFVRVTWRSSQVRQSTIDIVSGWNSSSSTAGPSALDSGDPFGWNSARDGNRLSGTRHNSSAQSHTKPSSHSGVSSKEAGSPGENRSSVLQFAWSSVPDESQNWNEQTNAVLEPVSDAKPVSTQGSDPKSFQNDQVKRAEAGTSTVNDSDIKRAEDADWGDWGEIVDAELEADESLKSPTNKSSRSAADDCTHDLESPPEVKMNVIDKSHLLRPKRKSDPRLPDIFLDELPAKSAVRSYLERKTSSSTKPGSQKATPQAPTPVLRLSESSLSICEPKLSPEPCPTGVPEPAVIPVEKLLLTSESVDHTGQDLNPPAFELPENVTPSPFISQHSTAQTISESIFPPPAFSAFTHSTPPPPVTSSALESNKPVQTNKKSSSSLLHSDFQSPPLPKDRTDENTAHVILDGLSSFSYMFR